MAHHDTDIYETKDVVNVTYEIDRDGRGWYCYNDEDLGECSWSDEVIYDRGFGG